MLKVAKLLERVVFKVSRFVSTIAVVILLLMVLLIIAEVISRRAFSAPIPGVFELTSLSLILVVFLTLAYCAAKRGHVELDIVTTRFPKRTQAAIATVIYFLTTVILGLASWQLAVRGVTIQNMQQTSGILEIEIYPFVYLATFGCILLTLVYLTYFLYSLDEVLK